MVPETINEYQKDCFKTLIERLKKYHTDIEFDDGDGYAKDKYNILKYKNNSL